jgi:alpha-beta hydrolase superfamily lysophospholipase
MTWLKRIGRLSQWVLIAVALAAIACAVLLAVPVSSPAPLDSIRAGALAIDRSGLPDVSHIQASDGTTLAYRRYAAADGSAKAVAIVIHGSAGHSTSMNAIAKRLAADNFVVIAPDLRGHGQSGTRGDIAYYGQLDDDFEDLVLDLKRQYPAARFALLGFSSGGGFALRIASGKLASSFERLVMLSPYLGYDAPSTRNAEGAPVWAAPDRPRLIALAALRRLHLTCCEELPVLAFAVAPGSEKYVTSRYSYRLLMNFAAPRALGPAFHRLKMPAAIVVGGADELMLPDKYADVVRGISPSIDITIVPGLNHMDMLHALAAIDAISDAMRH